MSHISIEGYRKASAEVTATSFHGSPAGGGILIGRNASGDLLRAVIGAKALPRDPNPGETWRVTGEERDHPEYGRQLHAEVALPLLPSGRTLVRFLATNPRFRGIGWSFSGSLRSWRRSIRTGVFPLFREPCRLSIRCEKGPLAQSLRASITVLTRPTRHR